MAERPNPEWLRKGQEGVEAWNRALLEWNAANTSADRGERFSFVDVNLSRIDLPNVRFDKCDLHRIDFTESSLRGASFEQASLNVVSFPRAFLDEASFAHANCRSVNFESASLRATNFFGANCDESCKFVKARFSNANLESASCRRSDFNHADLSYANCRGTTFGFSSLDDAILAHALCQTAIFQRSSCIRLRGQNCRLEGTRFEHVNLEGADLRGSTANPDTEFSSPKIDGCRVDRYFLDSLPDGEKGLPRGHRMQMVITDDVATLRMSYSGFLAWVHFLALLAFVFPYLWFTGKQYAIARFAGTEIDSGVPLWKAISLYIWTGGVEWHEGRFNPLPFSLAVLSLLYNALRGLLLWKTKSLELQEAATALPAKFSLVGRWGVFYRMAWIWFWINLLLILLHSGHFLGQVVPVPNG